MEIEKIKVENTKEKAGGEISLEELRAEIDEADRELIAAFEKRMDAVFKIAYLKSDKGFAVKDQKREDEVMNGILEKTHPEYRKAARALYEKIFEISRDNQNRVLDFMKAEDLD